MSIRVRLQLLVARLLGNFLLLLTIILVNKGSSCVYLVHIQSNEYSTFFAWISQCFITGGDAQYLCSCRQKGINLIWLSKCKRTLISRHWAFCKTILTRHILVELTGISVHEWKHWRLTFRIFPLLNVGLNVALRNFQCSPLATDTAESHRLETGTITWITKKNVWCIVLR